MYTLWYYKIEPSYLRVLLATSGLVRINGTLIYPTIHRVISNI